MNCFLFRRTILICLLFTRVTNTPNKKCKVNSSTEYEICGQQLRFLIYQIVNKIEKQDYDVRLILLKDGCQKSIKNLKNVFAVN